MLCKAKDGVLAAFKSGIPYSAHAERFIPGMEDGYIFEAPYGDLYIKRAAFTSAMNKKYALKGYCILTPLGLIEITTGDYIITSDKGKFVATKEQFIRFYEVIEGADT